MAIPKVYTQMGIQFASWWLDGLKRYRVGMEIPECQKSVSDDLDSLLAEVICLKKIEDLEGL